jgi:hypothetical protein
MNYTMEVMDSGIVIRGPSPMDQMKTIEKMAKAAGFDQLDIGLGQALGATLVITNAKGSASLRAEVETANKGKSKEDAWICGYDTGTSSKTIFAVMRGTEPNHADMPYDPDDFGRCYRLLALIPEWRLRLGEVAAKYPRWTGLIDNWGKLTELYEAENWKQLYARMQELIK